jgi:hypothetical protein
MRKLPPLPANSDASVTLRNYFTTIALGEIIASRPQKTAEKKALEAYQIADSMMRPRERAVSGFDPVPVRRLITILVTANSRNKFRSHAGGWTKLEDMKSSEGLKPDVAGEQK